jgi:TRAP-type C4-dicarboxylate transport system substrate-binding protein
LASYFVGETVSVKGAQLFAKKATEDSDGTMQVSLEVIPPWMPLRIMSEGSSLAHYCAPDFADIEPIFGLSALPMLTATFDEAEALLRIAKPQYGAALARHGQILLATQPCRPVALWSTFRLRSVADLRGAPFPVSSAVGEKAGWSRTFIRLGARHASYSEAEFLLSSARTTNSKYTREFAYFTEIFLAVPLNFLTVSRRVFDSLTQVQADVLTAAGRAFEFSQWNLSRELMYLDHREIAAQGVPVSAQAPADVMAALRSGADPEIRSWAKALGQDAASILANYRRAMGMP